MEEIEPNPRDVPASSPLASLRQRIRTAREDSTIDWEVPVDDDLTIVVRYGMIDFDTLDRITNRGKGKGTSAAVSLEQACSLMVHACRGVFIDQGDGPVSIDVENSDCYIDADGVVHGTPLTFSDERLAEIFGVDSGRAADVAKAVIPYELAIPEHGTAVIRFSQGESVTAIRAAMGK